ncbi:Kelch repeat type 1 [Arabidopsis suecica]|uniref:Kelch repeat type 1 n=1 Tax=Arabidopsis suecica TaxID=45249 RepID=A0A8T1YEP7_ARASU|nr:Kelch repeat type 1 [Arabidopsis suecica]
MSFPARSSVDRNGEEPPVKKKKTSQVLPQTPQLYPILPLPDDLVLSCLARVSRSYYPILSLVNKSFRSLLASPELYETRSLLDRTESCLYVCLRLPPDFNTSWFILCRRPNRTQKKKKKNSNGSLLIPIPSLQSPPAHSSGLVAVGSNIYNIGGGPTEDTPSSTVSVLDCKSHAWREAPSMLVERKHPASNVVDGKIYVAGGCKNCNSSNWMEVFDTKTQTWELVSCPLAEQCESRIDKNAVVEGEIFMSGDKGVAYKPNEDRWKAIGPLSNFDLGWEWLSYSVIDNVLFCYSNLDGISWYNSKIGNWLNLKGLKGLPKFADYSRVKLADYGGKMVILWDKYVPSSGYKNKMIWCAVIALERHNNQEIWGRVEGLDAVLTVPKTYEFVCALSVTV